MVGSEVLITNDIDKGRQTIRLTAMFTGNKRASYKFLAEDNAATIEWVDCMAKAAASGPQRQVRPWFGPCLDLQTRALCPAEC
eukprot:SAG22_NODE_155_length_17123_cov_37.528489_14_plen_83_part_00